MVSRLKVLFGMTVAGAKRLSAGQQAWVLPPRLAVAGQLAASTLRTGGRMTSLVLELQRDALNPDVRCGDLLRKAFFVARKLQVAEFAEWISCEMNGYVGKQTPDYRRISGQLRVMNPYHGLQPLYFEDPDTTKAASAMLIAQPVVELEHLIAEFQPGGSLTMKFPAVIEQQMMNSMQPIGLQPLLEISRASIVGIIDAVRNTILEWSMKLEEQGILGNGLSFTPEERSQAPSTVPTFITHIHGNVSHSQIAPGATSPTQNVWAAADGGLTDLLRALTDAVDKLGASQEDRAELRAEIATIRAQLASPRPKNTIVAESLRSIRTVLEGAAGNMLASALLPQLAAVASRLL